jgi:hypothetical protein
MCTVGWREEVTTDISSTMETTDNLRWPMTTPGYEEKCQAHDAVVMKRDCMLK